MEDGQFVKRARQVSREFQEQIDRVKGKQIRVLRAVVYEGEGEAVMRCLSGSLPVGKKWITREAPHAYSITVSQDEIVILPEPARIEVCRLDPDTLVGIAPCDDGEPGWVVMAVQPDPDAPTMEVIAPVSDEHGDIVYTDILDAAEVLRTGIVWKHDMGEDEATDDPDSGPLEDVEDPDSGPLDTVIPEIAAIPDRPCDEQGRIEYTVTYRRRETGEQVVTRFWSHPGRSREYLIKATRHTVITTAAKLGRHLDWRVVERSIDPDSYVFDPPPSGADVDPLVATRD